MNPTAFQMSISIRMKRRKKGKNPGNSEHTILLEMLSLRQGVGKRQKILKYFMEWYWQSNSGFRLALSKWMNVLWGGPGFSLRKRGPTGNMEWEKLWGSIGMNFFLKYMHAEAFSCNIYACMFACSCRYCLINSVHQRTKNPRHPGSNEHSRAQTLVSNIITH